MFALVLQIFFGREHLVKNHLNLISTLDKVIYLENNFFRGLQNFSSLHKIGWKLAENLFPPFSNFLLLE
jgi:hypothetical protein